MAVDRLEQHRVRASSRAGKRSAWRRLVWCVVLAGCAAWSAQATAAEKWPVLKDVTVEQIDSGVRLHFVVDGVLPATEDFSFPNVPKVLLDPKGILVTGLPSKIPAEFQEVLAIELIKDPTLSTEGLAPGSYPVDMIALQFDQPRNYWVLTLGTELVVDVGEPSKTGESRLTPLEGREVTSAEEAGLTHEEVRGMLHVPLINPLPKPPEAPSVPAAGPSGDRPRPSAQEPPASREAPDAGTHEEPGL